MRRDIAVGLVLILVTLAVYWQVGNHQFVDYDDPYYVTQNLHVRQGLDGRSLAWAFTSTELANWHPLTWLSHMLDWQLFGAHPRGHHLSSLFIHLVNVTLLLAVLKRMTGALWRSALVSALFALHPLHVESVAWVAERKDVLSTSFWLLTMLAYARYAERPSRGRYAWALAAFALGLMTKPMLVTLPFVLMLLDWWPLGRLARGKAGEAGASAMPAGRRLSIARLVWEKVPFLVLAAISSAITLIAQQQGGAIRDMEMFPLVSRVANALVSYVWYGVKMIWPIHLAVLYPHPGAGISLWWGAAAGLVLLALTILLLSGARARPWLAVGWFWFLGTLVPVIGLVQVGVQAHADRYTYVPLIGLFILVAWGSADLAGRWERARRALAVGVVAVLAALAAVTWAQLGYWKDSVSLFSRALDVTRGNYVMHSNLGLVLARQGRPDEATAQFRQSLRIKPDYAEAHNNLGNVLADQGKPEDAIAEYTEALRLRPGGTQTMNNLGTVLLQQGRLEEAADRFREALRLQPDHAPARCNLGLALEGQGRLEEAMAQYREVLRRNPDYAPAHDSLGIVLARLGRFDEAAAEFRAALRINPGDEGARRNLSAVLGRMGGRQGDAGERRY